MSPLHPTIAALPPIIAHRGASGTAPENTLAAIEHAAQLGARAIEIDVMLCADAHPIVIHDTNLARTTDGKGPVAAADLAQIRALDAGSWFAPEFAGQLVPRLEEALDLIAGRGMALNLEIKPTRGRAGETAEVSAQILAERWPDGLPLLVSSSSEAALRVMGRALPDLPLGLISGGVPSDWRRRLTRLVCVSLHAAHDKISPPAASAPPASAFSLTRSTIRHGPRRCSKWG